MSQKTQTLGVYVHWPFCVSKCPYCDFNSHVANSVDINKWQQAFQKEIEFSALQSPDHTVHTIFFGGGTPSLMPSGLVADVVHSVKKNWKTSENLEVTLEANPTSVEANKFAEFKAAGVNRLSIGIQAFNDQDLNFLGRPHNISEGIKAIECAQKYFDRYSFDLIYARPNQTVASWTEELETALKYAAKHISLYQLTIEKGTQFYTAYNRGDFFLPTDVVSAELYNVTAEILCKKGLMQYEISNYAIPGEESHHNLIYWNYDDYVGVGPGAHGRITLNGQKCATRRHRAPDIWLDKVLKTGNGQVELAILSPQDQLVETLMMGLRLNKGLSFQKLDALCGESFSDLFAKQLTPLYREGLINKVNNLLQATDEGRIRLNSLLDFLINTS